MSESETMATITIIGPRISVEKTIQDLITISKRDIMIEIFISHEEGKLDQET